MAERVVADGTVLPARYWAYARRWEALGSPAFFAMLVIYSLMVNKSVLYRPWQVQ